MSECRNPECRNKYTPGVVTSGKGTPNAPVLGATMRWGWVRCLACNSTPDDAKNGATYKHFQRSPAEVQERARLADSKAPYVHQAVAKRPALEAIASTAPPPAPAASNNAVVEKLLGQVEKLTDQVTALLEENRLLRQERNTDPAPIRKVVKKKVKVKRNGSEEE